MIRKLFQTGARLFLLAVVLTAASTIWLDAHAATTATTTTASESRPVEASVTQVVMNGPVDLTLRPAATPALYVKGDPRLVSRVTTRVEGNVLYVGTRGIFIATGQSEQTRVELSLPMVEKVTLQGSGDAVIKGFKGARLELVQRGSGDINAEVDYQQMVASLMGSGNLQLQLNQADRVDISVMGSGDAGLKGQARTLNAKLYGSGDLNSAAMKAASVQVEVNGSGDAKVSVSDELNAGLSGSGDLFAYGNPARRQIRRNGSGDVVWR